MFYEKVTSRFMQQRQEGNSKIFFFLNRNNDNFLFVNLKRSKDYPHESDK